MSSINIIWALLVIGQSSQTEEREEEDPPHIHLVLRYLSCKSFKGLKNAFVQFPLFYNIPMLIE